jgi:hypothetical protein
MARNHEKSLVDATENGCQTRFSQKPADDDLARSHGCGTGTKTPSKNMQRELRFRISGLVIAALRSGGSTVME